MAVQGQMWRFMYADAPIRGVVVRLDESWQQMGSEQAYPQPLSALLGQVLVAGPLLMSGLKFNGQISLQGEGQGAIQLMVMQVTHALEVRAVIRHQAAADFTLPFAQQFGEQGQLRIMFEPQQGQHYQSVVPLHGERLEEALCAYFGQSEQLPTAMRLHADAHGACGVLLQRLPGHEYQALDEFEQGRMNLLTFNDSELQSQELPVLLKRLGDGQDIRLFEPEPVQVRCRCSHARTSQMLLSLGRDEVQATLEQEGEVDVQCGFCGQHYRYDAHEVQRLFAAADAEVDPSKH